MTNFTVNRSSLVITFLLLISISALSQRQITGRVLDTDTKKPIKEAKVRIADSSIETMTNALGFFQLNIDTAEYLIIESKDYEISQIKIPDVNSFQINLTHTPPSNSDEKTFVIVEQQPDFPGGIGAFFKYLDKNLKYPKDARADRIEGKVFVSFVIDTTGAILTESVAITKSLSKSCDEEAIRLIKESPKWLPGRQNQKAVKVRFVTPVIFKR